MTTALTWIEIKLLAREPLTLVVSLLFPTVLMLLLLASFGSEPDEAFAGLGGTDFYVPSYLGAAIAVMGFAGIPTRLASYRQEGVLRRFRAAGVPAGPLMASQAVLTAVLSVLGAAVMLALAYTGFDMAPPVSVPGTLLGFAVGVVAFSALGLFLGSMIPTARAAQGVGLLLFFGTFFLVGGGPPPSLLPDALNIAVEFTPIGQLADAIRSPWTGAGNDVTALVALAATALVTGVVAHTRLGRLDLG